jgi:ABC-type Fe3+/spermidine/putrescine transport system ATPase subunit
MHNGKILQKGSPESLYRQPGSLPVARFLGASNTLAGRVKSDGLVELADGSTLPCRTGRNLVADEVVIVCRPEAFRLIEAGSLHSVSGQLHHSGFLGRDYEHAITLKTNERITAHSRKGPYTPGTSVTVTLNPELAFAFALEKQAD